MSRRAALWVSAFLVLAFALVVGSVVVQPVFEASQAAAPADPALVAGSTAPVAEQDLGYTDDDDHEDADHDEDDDHDKTAGSHSSQSSKESHDDDDDD